MKSNQNLDINLILQLKSIKGFKLSNAQEAVYQQWLQQQSYNVKPHVARAGEPTLKPLTVKTVNRNRFQKVTGVASES